MADSYVTTYTNYVGFSTSHVVKVTWEKMVPGVPADSSNVVG